MLETPHVLVGATIAAKVGNPLLAIPLAFLSHFALEKVPHWNPHLNTEKRTSGKVSERSLMIIFVDSGAALVAGGAIAYSFLPDVNRALVILAASLAAVLPDLIEAPYYFMNHKSEFIEKKWIPFKKSLQVDTTPLPGLLTQVVTSVFALLWLTKI